MIAGLHSVTELKDLLKAKDSEMSDMAKAVADFGDTWKANDQEAYNSWMSQYDTLKSSYSRASVLAKAEIFAGSITPFVSDDNLPAETGYQQIISSLQQTPGVVSNGDFQDLFTRIQAARTVSGLQQYVETPITQPSKGSDTDLNLLQAADKAQKQIDKAVPSKSKTGIVIAVAGIGVIGFALMQINQFRRISKI